MGVLVGALVLVDVRDTTGGIGVRSSEFPSLCPAAPRMTAEATTTPRNPMQIPGICLQKSSSGGVWSPPLGLLSAAFSCLVD